MNKKLICVLTSLLLFTSPLVASQEALPDIPQIAICPPMADHPLTINSELLHFPDAYMQNSTLMIPLRESGESLGFTVKWDASTQSVYLDNQSVNTTLKVGVNEYYTQSSAKPSHLTESPTLKNGKLYVPYEIFNTLCSNLATEQSKPAKGLKSLTLSTNLATYSFELTLPDYISEYVTLESENINFNTNDTYPMVFLKFQNKDKVSNIGHFSILTKDQFDLIQQEEGPKEVVILKDDPLGIVITFAGLQDMPFDLGTLEAELVGKYHSETETVLKSINIKLLSPIK